MTFTTLLDSQIGVSFNSFVETLCKIFAVLSLIFFTRVFKLLFLNLLSQQLFDWEVRCSKIGVFLGKEGIYHLLWSGAQRGKKIQKHPNGFAITLLATLSINLLISKKKRKKTLSIFCVWVMRNILHD